MTCNERVECILKGGIPDCTPLHARTRMIPNGNLGREIIDKGWGLGASHPAYTLEYRDIGIDEEIFIHNGEKYVKTTYHTCEGDLIKLSRVYHHGGMVDIEHIFKQDKDYKALLALIESIRYKPEYQGFTNLKNKVGEDGYVWVWLGYDPMHEIMVKMMGVERFSYEWVDNKEEILKLYGSLCKKHEDMYVIAAESPAQLIVYGGNIQANIVSPNFFKDYYLPLYNNIGIMLHNKGKLLGNHWDGPVGALKELVAKSPIDVLEAFCPPPDGDMSIKEAIEIWPDKIISMNFPSGLQHLSEDQITNVAKAFIDEAGTGERFMISLTEDFPSHYAEKIFYGIAEAVKYYESRSL